MNDEFPTRLSHIHDACIDLEKMTEGISSKDFLNDITKQQASSFLFIVIGEAASVIRDELEKTLPMFPWTDIIAMRNRIAHGYFSVNYKIVWKTIIEKIPQLQKNVKKILDSLHK